MLIIDDREPKQMQNLLRDRTEIFVQRLSTGDYLAGEIGIERKTISDLFSSVASGRLQEQLIRLRTAYPKHVLLLEGLLDMTQLAKPEWLCICLAECILQGATLLLSPSPEFSANLLARMSTNTSPQVFVCGKKVSLATRQCSVLQQVPGIGRIKAHKLLMHFGSLNSVFHAKQKQLQEVGVGRKTRSELHAIFHQVYDPSFRNSLHSELAAAE